MTIENAAVVEAPPEMKMTNDLIECFNTLLDAASTS